MAGLAAVSLLAPQAAHAAIPAAIPGTGDIQVLNFALALEDLEADLYAQALLRLTTGGTDPQGVATIPGLNVATSEIDVAYIQKFSAVEAAHRDFLKAALGSQAITTLKPAKYDFGIQTMTRQQVLDLVLEAEATGVQAYLGAIPSFTPQSQYLPTAAAIQGTEARHTSVLTIVRNHSVRADHPGCAAQRRRGNHADRDELLAHRSQHRHGGRPRPGPRSRSGAGPRRRVYQVPIGIYLLYGASFTSEVR